MGLGIDMLTYHPAFDFYHCIFRMLRLLERLPKTPHELVKLRILDFYLLFPSELKGFEFPRNIQTKKRNFQKENIYERIEDPKRILMRLEPFQITACKSLCSHGLIDPKVFDEGKILRTSLPLPESLLAKIGESNLTEPEPIGLLTGPFNNIDLYGKSGLKKRSDLFTYRYDAR